MRYAIISDIHANPEAFKVVLADARQQKADRVICLGDITGYGYDAVESYALAKENCDVLLLGNHDAACARVCAENMICANPNYNIDRAEREELGRDTLAEIRSLPYTFSNRHFACAHGDFIVPQNFGYILSANDARHNFRACNMDLMFIGHTYEAKVWTMTANNELETSKVGKITLKAGCRYIVNVGSAGYPRHDFFSSYALFDSRARTVDLRRLDFDFPSYIAKMQKKGIALPFWLELLSQVYDELFKNAKNT